MATILGVKFFGHDTGAAIFHNNKIVAISEERLDRIKHSGAFPRHSINYCLEALKLSPSDVDLIVSDQVGYRNERASELKFHTETCWEFRSARFVIINHHDAHAASAFFASPFDSSAVLVYDSAGERFLTNLGAYGTETESLYRGKGNKLFLIRKHLHNRSGRSFRYTMGIGRLYSFFATEYLNFGAHGQGKMMGLAPYGDSSILNSIPECKWFKQSGGAIVCNRDIRWPYQRGRWKKWLIDYALEMIARVRKLLLNRRLRFVDAPKMFQPVFLPRPPRRSEDPVADRYYASIAFMAQKLLEDVASFIGRDLKNIVSSDFLCIAGGLGLNLEANNKFRSEVGFNDVFIQPACSDAGIPLGCLLWGRHVILGEPRSYIMNDAFLGRSYSEDEFYEALKHLNGDFSVSTPVNVASETATLIADRKIVGWFQGRSEYGPRALGNRSILADSRYREMHGKLNEVKGREKWRPFGVSVLGMYAAEFFHISHQSPFMLASAIVRDHAFDKIPAACHIDMSCRIQTVDETNGAFHKLLNEFQRLTGVPLILNTSFNLAGEPIVESPQDAIISFMRSDIDALVIGRHLIKRTARFHYTAPTPRQCSDI